MGTRDVSSLACAGIWAADRATRLKAFNPRARLATTATRDPAATMAAIAE